MKIIKFRGKSIEDGIWKYGSLVVTDDNKNEPFITKPIKQTFQIVYYNQGDWNMGGWDYVNVDSNTIGQFTGLYDKNGKEIYEGDIVNFDDTPYCANGSKYTGVVVIYRGSWRVKYCLPWHDEYFYAPLFADDFAGQKTKILGNMYDY